MGSYHQLVEAATVAESNKRASGIPRGDLLERKTRPRPEQEWLFIYALRYWLLLANTGRFHLSW